MGIEPLYVDFFKFLDQWKEEGDPWPIYRRLYLDPHRKFFEAYWKTSDHFSPDQILERVRRIKAGDYGQLRSLLQGEDPIGLTEEALKRCRRNLPLQPEPSVYLSVGFFSADGFTLEVEGLPSIVLGLERFQDFRDLTLLVSHEYAHCGERLLLRDFFARSRGNLVFSLAAEGFSVLFTESVYPEIPLHRHLFLTPERLQWCRENEGALLGLAGADLATEKLVPILFGAGDPNAGLPPRVGYFIARQMIRHCLMQHGAREFSGVFPGFQGLFQRIVETCDLQDLKSEG